MLSAFEFIFIFLKIYSLVYNVLNIGPEIKKKITTFNYCIRITSSSLKFGIHTILGSSLSWLTQKQLYSDCNIYIYFIKWYNILRYMYYAYNYKLVMDSVPEIWISRKMGLSKVLSLQLKWSGIERFEIYIEFTGFFLSWCFSKF